jgi:hypothetical protein
VLLGVSPDHARGFGVTLDLSDKADKPRSWFDDRAAPAGFVEAAQRSESLHPLSEGLARARFRAPDPMRSTEPQALVLMESEDGKTLLLEHPHGRGRVVALASASPATNGELGWGDHAPLMARLLALAASPAQPAAGPPRVYFDEYHAGVGRRRSITGYLAQHGWLWPALQLGLFVAALLARGAASFGVPRPDPPAPPDDASTFVEGIGRIYERSRDVGGAAERLAKEAVGRLASSHALGPSIDPVALERELRQRGRTAAADVVGVAMLRASQLKSHPSPRVADLVGFARWLDAAVRQALEAHKQLGARANAAGDLSRLQSRRNA